MTERSWRTQVSVSLLAAALAAVVLYVFARPALWEDAHVDAQVVVYAHPENNRGQLNLWWEKIPKRVRRAALASTGSNIHRDDYAGPESCRQCHPQNYEDWSQHPHRWMNAAANDATVKGDFSGAQISFMGGRASFYTQDGQYRMRLERDSRSVEFAITQTIGSRFFQYYVGRQATGPFPAHHPINSLDHVLPFGYWLDEQEWVPVVHVAEADEQPDATRTDPFDFRSYPFPPYAVCNRCHTTFPLADLLSRAPDKLCRHVPLNMHWSLLSHLADEHPRLLPEGSQVATNLEATRIIHELRGWEAPQHAVTLGISCEACHLGGKQHALEKQRLPEFFPQSPHLLVEHPSHPLDYGRSHMNVNWACGRCHAGDRPQMAAGMSTWNSTEYTDALRGACYSQLTCIHCHDPHKPIGKRWSRTLAEDNASCTQCHRQFEDADVRRRHTHHAPLSEGDGCMNCHMPRINEGLQDVVRTHLIYSPTHRGMIEAKHPNACNLCHTDKPITWTAKYLNEWYDAGIPEALTYEFYPQRDQPAALGWMQSPHEQVRLVAAAALARNGDQWALPQLIEALDDPFLLNRQFARIGLERMLGIDLYERFGYRFYMLAPERRGPLERMRGELAVGSSAND